MKKLPEQRKSRFDKQEVRATMENFKWFSKFSPVEKLRIVKRNSDFIKILLDRNCGLR